MDHDQDNEHTASRAAEELAEAAAHTASQGPRLWRLQWAQAFKRLSELGAGGQDSDGGSGQRG
ncbi:MAG: hypothetical protein H7124_14085 [Phycisphaerales bacterium]|nr:hypothetical protein [Hyphomonadaceae bacterium]